jgi:hypothetical protein
MVRRRTLYFGSHCNSPTARLNRLPPARLAVCPQHLADDYEDLARQVEHWHNLLRKGVRSTRFKRAPG